ncbi:lipopolysaccharide transport periplasmic protein LptA [Thalassovita aquimarina]|uniref:Lipopolysaccharide transport periplasmic protein LptA n=1 Tax=Thalassovita aquimarina TaxID=2785917 RepID=A0ABS5HNP6_9RHOB|nr:lipopolysaccharide transport periplasmic protein LptA [Thalassovita aquimarina]
MRLSRLATFALCFFLTAPALPALAEDVAFGKARQDSDLPVEVSADKLSVSQKDGTATFTGNVVITQGDMILNAPSVLVVYKEDESKISRLEASGGITMVSGEDAAEAQSAEYDIDAGTVLLLGSVLLSQGPNVMSGDRITINLDAGTAQVGGRVKTTLQSGD